jgi:PAS domain S-box-containing protein
MNRVQNLEQRVKYLEEELRESRQLFQSIADAAPDVICRFNSKFEHLYVNPAITHATGIPTSNFLGKTPHQAGLPPPMADFWLITLTSILKKRKHTTIEFSFPSPGGERHFQTLLVPELNSEGEVEAVLTWTRDITEIKQQQKKGEEMFGVVSHELKTPLTSLKAFTLLLQKRVQRVNDPENSNLLAKMDKQINRLNSLIEDGLSTKTGSSGFLLHEDEFDLSQLIDETVSEMQQLNPNHRISVLGDAELKCFGDRERVNQVLINLLSNAMKYSPDSSEVKIQVKKFKSNVRCCIRDSGLGISKRMQNKIFDRYFRVKPDGPNNPPGLGLGLYISKEIVQRLGGKMWVKSEVG